MREGRGRELTVAEHRYFEISLPLQALLGRRGQPTQILEFKLINNIYI
jgi:hypothetical protein